MSNTDVSNAKLHWSKTEFSEVSFGDKRLNMRFQKTVEKLSDQPLSSINQACGNWANTKAAYRLFDNEKIKPEQILDPHRKKTQERIAGYSQVLVIQDTSFLNYTDHPSVTGLGGIGYKNKHKHKRDTVGLVMHTALAVSTDGISLGILNQEIWARDESKSSKKQSVSRQRVPVEEKESFKWLRGIMQTAPLIPPNVQAITVCDRESDTYEFISKAESLGSQYLVRSSWDRAIKVDSEDHYLWQYMEGLPSKGIYEIQVEAKRIAKQKIAQSRTAKMEVRYSRVDLKRNPKKKVNRKECFPTVASYVVWVKEINAPDGIEPLNWMLLTNVPVNSYSDAIERVRWYKLRWHIESFHKVLKSGCNIELCRLETADRLERYITLFSIIAWKLYWITHINRVSPDKSCEEFLSDHEWKALYCKINKTKSIPSKPPTIREATRWIAQLGGFLARKGDGDPGITTIWRGWQRLLDISEAWLVFNS